MICSFCATELPAGALFCGECGRPVSTRSTTASVPRIDPTIVIEELVPPAAREPVTVSADWDDLGEWTPREEPSIPDPVAAAAPSAPAAPAAVSEPVADEDFGEEVWPFTAPRSVFADVAPQPEREPVPDPAPEPPVASTADGVIDAASHGAGWCAQCGALLSASDIFCGECGFVRSPAARPRDTVAFDPFPWGAPRVEDRPAPTPSAPVVAPPPAPASVPVAARVPSPSEPDRGAIDDDTRIVPPGAPGERFILQFSTGESITVTGAGLLGRNPMPEPGEYFDSLVTISDPGKSVSKTHLEFGQEGGSFWVSDRYSGNGTVVREPDRPSRRCDPGKRYRIVRGTRVDIGEQFFVVS